MKAFLKQILPKKIIMALVNFNYKYLHTYGLTSYSQEGEDLILNRIFPLNKKGFYVDVGAHHPKRFSNTHFFYKRGWRGINIDAMPGSMNAFKKIRKKDINIEVPIFDDKKLLTFFAFNDPALNGFSKKISEERDKLKDYKIVFTKQIETTTLESVLDRNLPKDQHIDFLSIDVEGLDFNVLLSLNIEKYRPQIILIEIVNICLDEIKNEPIYEFFMKHNYVLISKTANTVFFQDNSQ